MNIELINFKINGNDDGSLVAIEELRNIPFEIKRVYYIFNTKPGVRRGFHAHKNLHQVIICVSGSCKFILDDGQSRQIVELSSPNCGLYIKEIIWREMFDFSSDCVLLVLASDIYRDSDYIRDYANFLKLVNK